METVMDEVRRRITDNKAALPGSHRRASELDLCPQPWWNRDFYDWAIKRAEAEQELS